MNIPKNISEEERSNLIFILYFFNPSNADLISKWSDLGYFTPSFLIDHFLKKFKEGITKNLIILLISSFGSLAFRYEDWVSKDFKGILLDQLGENMNRSPLIDSLILSILMNIDWNLGPEDEFLKEDQIHLDLDFEIKSFEDLIFVRNSLEFMYCLSQREILKSDGSKWDDHLYSSFKENLLSQIIDEIKLDNHQKLDKKSEEWSFIEEENFWLKFLQCEIISKFWDITRTIWDYSIMGMEGSIIEIQEKIKWDYKDVIQHLASYKVLQLLGQYDFTSFACINNTFKMLINHPTHNSNNLRRLRSSITDYHSVRSELFEIIYFLNHPSLHKGAGTQQLLDQMLIFTESKKLITHYSLSWHELDIIKLLIMILMRVNNLHNSIIWDDKELIDTVRLLIYIIYAKISDRI
jgi:hypothetical protein